MHKKPSKTDYSINESAYQRWVGNRTLLMGEHLDFSRPSIKGVIGLALLDLKDQPVSYHRINELVYQRGAVTSHGKNGTVPNGPIPLPTLRVALSDFQKSLNSGRSPYQLKTFRMGREVRMQLVNQGVRIEMDEPITDRGNETILYDPKRLALSLVRDGGGLPFANLYTTYRAAAWWLSFSTTTGMAKKAYEGRTFQTLGVQEALVSKAVEGRVGVLSLATGEGLGEVEILQRLLRPKEGMKAVKVEYVAVDASDILLMSHSKLIREYFSEELASGQLTFVPLVGDLYDLRHCLGVARARYGSEILKGLPVLVTFLGNCIGNNENQEWPFYRAVNEAFSEQWVCALVGVSLVRYGKKDAVIPEKYTIDRFLLETPRHLLYNLKVLRSVDSKGQEIAEEENKEFILEEASSGDEVMPHDYCTPQGIEGNVYRFFYQLKNRIQTWDGKFKLEAGRKILLYSITKYKLPTLLEALRTRGLTVFAPKKESEFLTITDGEEQFRYAVIAAISERN